MTGLKSTLTYKSVLQGDIASENSRELNITIETDVDASGRGTSKVTYSGHPEYSGEHTVNVTDVSKVLRELVLTVQRIAIKEAVLSRVDTPASEFSN